MTDTPIPPADYEAERAVLGAMMYSQDTAHEIGSRLAAADFSRPAHADIFAAIASLTADDRQADPIAVSARLEDQKLLEQCGGRGYVFDLASAALPGYEGHVAIVKDRAQRRALIRAAQGISQLAYGADSAAKAQDVSAQVLAEALGDAQDTGDVPLATALKDAMQQIVMAEHPDFLTLPDLPHTLLWPGSLTVLAARPSVGKSAWAMVAAEKWGREGVPVKVYTYEMTAERLALRVVARHSGLAMTYLGRGVPAGEHREAAWDAVEEVKALPITLRRGLRGGVDRLISDMRIFAGKGGRAVVIDYLALAVTGGRSSDRREDVAEAARRLKAAALSTGLVVLALWQLNRSGVRDDGTLRPPVLSDLKESGEAEQSTDIAVLLHRYDDREQEKVRARWADQKRPYLTLDPHETRQLGTIHVAKDRDGELLKLPGWWDPQRLTFELVDKEEA